jgi:hypothetical protein
MRHLRDAPTSATSSDRAGGRPLLDGEGGGNGAGGAYSSLDKLEPSAEEEPKEHGYTFKGDMSAIASMML